MPNATPTSSSFEIKPVHRRLLAAVTAQPEIPLQVLGLWFGLSTTEVGRILKLNGVERPKGRREREERLRLTPLHLRVGNRLSYVRVFTLDLTEAEMASMLGWGVGKLHGMEAGTAPVELRDLTVLAQFFHCTEADILNCQFGDNNHGKQRPNQESGDLG